MVEKNFGDIPYIYDIPIEKPGLFFGQEELFKVIKDNLRQEVQVILLNGQRCIGKSSILKQIPHKINSEKYDFVYFDPQNKTQLSSNKVLNDLVEKIIASLKRIDLQDYYKEYKSIQDKNSNLMFFSDWLLPKIYSKLGKKKLVLLLDEFDLLDEDNSNQKVYDFFRDFKSILKQYKQLVIISVVGNKPDEIPQLLNLFEGAVCHKIHEIKPLNRRNAEDLIIQPARSILEYEPKAIEDILKLSGNHPYFIQAICSTLFKQARKENIRIITCVEVKNIIDKVIEFASKGLACFRDGLPVAERIVFLAVAESQKLANLDHNNSDHNNIIKIIKNPLTILEEYGVYLTQSICEAINRLTDWHLIEPIEPQKYFSGTNPCYKIKIEIVSLWLVQQDSLREEIRELENIDHKIHNIYKATIALPAQNKENAKILYEQIIQLNPNHFSSLFELAEIYFNNHNFEQAVELYERAYKVDSFKNNKAYMRSLYAYADDLQINEDFDEAMKIYQKIQKLCDIDDNSLYERLRIKQQLKLIEKQKSNIRQKYWQFVKEYVSGWKGAVFSSFFIIFVLVGVGYLRLKPCPIDQIKENGVCITKTLPETDYYVPKWQPEIFSRGQQSFFQGIDNINRDRGIEEFKKQNYSEAFKFFERAIFANRNDPELLIYYNNSLVRKEYDPSKNETQPLTLAVIVPIDKNENDAQEILRGVAQAQHQFNDLGGFKGRLLEIVIVNNSNESSNAKQLAEEIIEDSSVKGIITHNTSIFNVSAIKDYQKNDLAIIALTDLDITNNNDFKNNDLFRVSPSEIKSGRKLADYIMNELRLMQVVIYYNDKSSYSQNLEQGFRERFKEELKGEIVRTIDISDSQLDAGKQVLFNTNEEKDNVEVALIFPDSQYVSVAIEIIRQNALLTDKKLRFFGSDALYSHETLVAGGGDVEGLTLAVPWFDKAEQSRVFSKAASDQWGGEVNWRTAMSFDATQAFIKAFSLSGGTSRSLVREKLQEVNLLADKTSGDELDFDENGERIGDPILVKVVKDKDDEDIKDKDDEDITDSELRFELVNYP